MGMPSKRAYTCFLLVPKPRFKDKVAYTTWSQNLALNLVWKVPFTSHPSTAFFFILSAKLQKCSYFCGLKKCAMLVLVVQIRRQSGRLFEGVRAVAKKQMGNLEPRSTVFVVFENHLSGSFWLGNWVEEARATLYNKHLEASPPLTSSFVIELQ